MGLKVVTKRLIPTLITIPSCHKYKVVRISLGVPRWKIAYPIAGAIKELTPAGLLKIEDVNEFAEKYSKMDTVINLAGIVDIVSKVGACKGRCFLNTLKGVYKMARYTLTKNYTEIAESYGVFQNSSGNAEIEITNDVAKAGIILRP